MKMDIYDGRLYLPPKDPQNPHDREVVHPETNANQVLMGGEDGETLSEHLGPQVVIGSIKPTRACLWYKVTHTDME